MSHRSPRGSGLLLHPTSLPGPYGIGDIGPAAHAWINMLAGAKQSWWQILPVGPTGFGDSPYQSYSTFAGNPNLVSPDLLVRDGLVRVDDLAGASFPADRVDYPAVERFKLRLVRKAWETFRSGQGKHLSDAYEQFLAEKRGWLGDYALFMAIRHARGGQPWYDWPPDLRRRPTPDAARNELADAVGAFQFGQFLFFRQWQELRRHAGEKGIRLIGDVPIFVSPDSADVWAYPQGYLLDANLRPKVVAGVPPDYFSKSGQLWGNPHYDWDMMKRDGYSWWSARLKATLELVDVVRLDHFRGFAAAWQVSAGEKTAVKGKWVPGPGSDLFQRLRADLGGLPLIAEDLGEITPDVHALRDEFGLPGMKVLHFAFDKPTNPFLPHNHTPNCVAYTGTHDNDTTRGWYATASEKERDFYRRYTARDGSDVSWDLIRLAWGSPADVAIAPVQDVMDLGTEARMNVPGVGEGNWRWRMPQGAPGGWALARLTEMTEVYARAPTKD
ncbi:MAG TPA: 4-alpha-glucanotransferase [Gemmataceae bacterium]|nr:4-alpha-glucanotransferase [Gemmataceae bacterium]